MQHTHQILAHQIDFAYRAGFTLQFDGLQVLHPPFAVLASRLGQELNHIGNIRVYSFLSPANAGARLHFDRTPNFIVQLEGSKRWRFSKTPVMADPPHKSMHSHFDSFRRAYPWAQVTAPDPHDMEELSLEPGDVLHMPAGVWHEAEAGEHSLALTIELDTMPLAKLVAGQLERKLMTYSEWRRTPAPIDPENNDAMALVERFRDELRERRGELAALVDVLTPEDSSLARVSRPGDA